VGCGLWAVGCGLCDDTWVCCGGERSEVSEGYMAVEGGEGVGFRRLGRIGKRRDSMKGREGSGIGRRGEGLGWGRERGMLCWNVGMLERGKKERE